MKNELPRLGNRQTKHLYRVEVKTSKGRNSVDVDANNRTQAVRLTRKAGFIVCSVNMVG